MPDKDLNGLFLDTVKDIYFAEKQIYKNLPKMAKAAASSSFARPSKSTTVKPRSRSSGSSRSSNCLASRPAAKPATRSRESLRKVRKSWTSTPARPR
jgi:BRCT domain type II-containing protein